MSPEDMQRFQIEPAAGREVLLWCTRCEAWSIYVAEPESLAELVQRAREHTEVCP